jgi:hypothetical protein
MFSPYSHGQSSVHFAWRRLEAGAGADGCQRARAEFGGPLLAMMAKANQSEQLLSRTRSLFHGKAPYQAFHERL